MGRPDDRQSVSISTVHTNFSAMKVILGSYRYIFYLVYKLLEITTPDNKRREIPNATFSLFGMSIILNTATIAMLTGASKFLMCEDYLPCLLLMIVFSSVLYFINSKVLKLDKELWRIVEEYDQSAFVPHAVVTVLSFVYVFGSLASFFVVFLKM
jgi:hypothetical protein